MEPTQDADPDREARRSLARARGFATCLLLFMAGMTLICYWLPDGTASQVLQAAAKAGFVGGVADWFAVVALFRHPLGLPIPHTAIIPRQKARLGHALGRFIATHVFTEAEVARTLSKIDLAGILHRFLVDPQATHPAAVGIASLLPRLLASVEDGRARRALGRLVPRILGGPGSSRVVARALRSLMDGGRHQEVFGFILGQLKGVLTEREGALSRAIEERVREQGGRLVGWAVGAQVARRVLAQLNEELEKVQPQGSNVRLAFDEWVRREIARIEEDPRRAAEMTTAIRRLFAHETLQTWIWDVWTRARAGIEADATRPDGRTVAFIEGALANLGGLLESDPGARARLQAAAESIVASLLPAAQTQLAAFIGEVVANWDADTVVERLELRVGRDLQFVRVNGTLVGFLVGGLVYAVLRATFGHASF